jgi:hypothetical protein
MQTDMRELSPLQNLVFRLGALLMLAGLLVRLFNTQVSLWLFGIGAMAFCLMRLQAEYLGRNLIVRRLRRQQLLGCVFFLLTVLCMSMQTYQYGPLRRNEWMVALAVACVLEVYTAWRLPFELENPKKS